MTIELTLTALSEMEMGHLPIIKNGAARFKPMNSIPKYIQKPNAANVAIIADKFPRNPSHGFDRTTSPIIHVITLKFQDNSFILHFSP